MVEPVSLPHAHECDVGVPHLKSLCRQSVGTAVVWHLEHFDGRQCAVLDHSGLCCGLGISRQDDVQLPHREVKYDARIVRLKLFARLGRGPEDHDAHLAYQPRIAGSERLDGRVRPKPDRVFRHTRRPHPRYAHPPYRCDSRQARRATRVIVVSVRHHQRVYPTYPVSGQCTPQHGLVGTDINEHRAPAVAHEHRVALSDIEHDHAALPGWGGADGKRRAHADHNGGHTTGDRGAGGPWPPHPYADRTCHRSSDQ